MWPAGNVARVRIERLAGTAVTPAGSGSWLCCTPVGVAVEPDV